jgi:cytoskeletal protein CcmA (bactofilin family)
MIEKNVSATKQTLVEEGTQFKGSLSSNCAVVVRGKIEGDVAAPSLTVSSSGAVHGRVKVADLRSSGELSGEFDADIVQLSGSVKDKTIIRAKSLEVRLTQSAGMQVVFGDCSLDIGDPPTKESVVRAATASTVTAAEAARPATSVPAVEPVASVRPASPVSSPSLVAAADASRPSKRVDGVPPASVAPAKPIEVASSPGITDKKEDPSPLKI